MSRIDRRSFLRAASVGCACSIVGSHVLAESAGGETVGNAHAHKLDSHWDYEGQAGPEHWGELTPEFRTCQLGLEQTPIDLTGSVKGSLTSVDLRYQPTKFRVKNNGHTIQADADDGSFVTIDNQRFSLKQFHFHHRSEHLVEGKSLDMELHFVNVSAEKSIAVVGVFIKAGAPNAALQKVLDLMPTSAEGEARDLAQFDPTELIPRARSFYRYMGSLTTPPCSEGLTWTIFREPIDASVDQIRAFAALFPNNARPVQRRNRRFIIETSSN